MLMSLASGTSSSCCRVSKEGALVVGVCQGSAPLWTPYVGGCPQETSASADSPESSVATMNCRWRATMLAAVAGCYPLKIGLGRLDEAAGVVLDVSHECEWGVSSSPGCPKRGASARLKTRSATKREWLRTERLKTSGRGRVGGLRVRFAIGLGRKTRRRRG